MNKSLRITLQIILYLLSISGILIFSHEFPNDLIGIIVISLFMGLSTYYLWYKTSKNILIKSIIILIVLDFLKISGGEGIDFSQKINEHFSNLVQWLLTTIMIIVLNLLLIKVLFFDKNKKSENEELKKK
jgi:hypothetical protein